MGGRGEWVAPFRFTCYVPDGKGGVHPKSAACDHPDLKNYIDAYFPVLVQHLKEKKFKEAIEACDKSNGYVESANAYKLAASAATKLKDNAKAIGFYEKYLEVSPDAKDANAISFTVAALYQQANNKAKAIEFYEKVAGDAQYGAQAKQQLEALKK